MKPIPIDPKDLRHWLPLPVGPCCVCGAAGACIEHRCGAFACGVPREGRPACWKQHENTCEECRRLVALEGGPYEWAASISESLRHPRVASCGLADPPAKQLTAKRERVTCEACIAAQPPEERKRFGYEAVRRS